MTRDDLIREYKEHSGTWPALVGIYAAPCWRDGSVRLFDGRLTTARP